MSTRICTYFLSVIQYFYYLRQPYRNCTTWMHPLSPPPPSNPTSHQNLGLPDTTISSTPTIFSSALPPGTDQNFPSWYTLRNWILTPGDIALYLLQDHFPHAPPQWWVILVTIFSLPWFIHTRSIILPGGGTPPGTSQCGGLSPLSTRQISLWHVQWTGINVPMYAHLWPPAPLSFTDGPIPAAPFGGYLWLP